MTIMGDHWIHKLYDGSTDGKARTLLHLLLHCSMVTLFIKLVYALVPVKDATLNCWMSLCKG